MSEFRQKTLTGITWSLGSQLGRQGVVFVVGVILARLLSPREFGLVAMVTIIIGFATIFSELGFGGALVQKDNVDELHLSSVFWLNLGVGALLTIFFIVGAPLVAHFYEEPILVPLTTLLSFNFMIGSVNIVQRTLLMKSLDFRKLSVIEIVAVTVAGGVAILLAYAGFGVWSLVIQSLLLSAMMAILLWVFSSWRPKWLFNWNAVKELLGFSTSLFGTSTLNYTVRNIDYVLIGRFLGPNPLGIYSRAYSVMLFPLANISRVITRVMFPSFSIIQENKKRVKRIYLKLTRVVALFAFPIMLGIFVTAYKFVLVIFGEQWLAMVPILRVLCFVGLIQSIVSLNGNLYLSQGRADLQFKIGLILRINLILGIIIGLQWGLIGVAIGYAIAVFINSYPNIFFAGRLVGVTLVELIKGLLPILGIASVMAICVWILGMMLPQSLPDWAALATQVVVGVIVYLMLLHIFKVKTYIETKELLIEQWRKRHLLVT